MQYIEAYLLALLEGEPSPTITTIAIIFARAAVKFDPTEAQNVIDACKGKTADQLLAEGVKKPEIKPKPRVQTTKKPVSLLYHLL